MPGLRPDFAEVGVGVVSAVGSWLMGAPVWYAALASYGYVGACAGARVATTPVELVLIAPNALTASATLGTHLVRNWRNILNLCQTKKRNTHKQTLNLCLFSRRASRRSRYSAASQGLGQC